jgi:hypothetical protein
MTEWLRLVKRHALDDGFANVAGYPVADVAARLHVSTQRVYQMIESGTFDIIEIVNKAGRVSLTLITEASLDRYLEKRVPDRGRQGYFAFP